MPRLFDLLNDTAKKGLIAEAKKGGGENKKSVHSEKKPYHDDRKSVRPENKSYHDDGKHTHHEKKPYHNDRKPTPQEDKPYHDNRKSALTIPDFVALDVETTGLDFKLDRVIEIGAIRFVGGRPEGEFSAFVNPGIPVPDHITRLTQISDSDVRDAPVFSEIAPKLLEFIGTLPLCGHQAEFDLSFVNAELKRSLFPEIAPQLLDTALMSRVLLQHVGRFSLKHACEAVGVSLDNAHRAGHDARASGELAVRLIPMIGELPLDVRQALAAFAPGSVFKSLLIKSLAGTRYGVNLSGGAPPADRAYRLEIPDDFAPVDVGQIKRIFSGEDGKAVSAVKGFAPRPAQRDMAIGVANALNGNGILVAEAGTGTGKSLAYLVPAALHALKNNCRVIISTHTRNLQDQLINNDLPAVAAICNAVIEGDDVGDATGRLPSAPTGVVKDNANNRLPSAPAVSNTKLRFTKLKGRSNYICRNRFYKLLRGDVGNLSPRERNSALPLVVWSQTTQTGDIEEQTFFNPKWFFKVWNLISADSLDCPGRRCPHYSSCFLHRARQRAQTSHIVVINHALFYSDVCSESSILGGIGSIVFDEAHHLESSGHQYLRTEFDTNRTAGFIDRLQNLLHAVAECKVIDVGEFEKVLKDQLKNFRRCSQDLLSDLDRWASAADPASKTDYQITINGDSLASLRTAAVVDVILGELKDAFHRLRQMLLDINPSTYNNKTVGADGNRPVTAIDKIEELREDAQACSEQTSQLRADLQYLVSAKTEDHVFWVEGNHEKKWAKLCGVPLDISGLLAQIWERCGGGVVFTSATLATQEGSTDYFKRVAGLDKFADKTESIILQSPYSAAQTLFCALSKCPEPDHPAFAPFAAETIAAMHLTLGKNILVLFTSNAMLNNVFNHLKSRPDIDNNNILAQNFGGNRNSMLEQFKTQSGMILLGTDSFWEGVDAPGEACEAVVIPRLPFPVPTHPLTMALGKRMEELYGSSFFSYSVPEAIIKFRQGTGRLIRSSNDRGTLVVLDNRIITKGYGKQFSRVIKSPLNDFGVDINGMIDKMKTFFESKSPIPYKNDGDCESNIKYVPFEDLL